MRIAAAERRIFLTALIAGAIGATDLLLVGPMWIWLICLIAMAPAVTLVVCDYLDDARAVDRALRAISSDEDIAALRRHDSAPFRRTDSRRGA